MYLNNRNVKIIEYIINASTEVKIKNLIDYFMISKRNLYYDFGKINDWLSINSTDELIISKGFVSMTDSAKRVSLNMMRNPCIADYVMSEEERQSYILFYILLNRNCVTIESIGNDMFLSRNTIRASLVNLEKRLKRNNVELIREKSGISIVGSENIIRYLLMQSFFDDSGLFSRRLLRNISTSKILNLFNVDKVAFDEIFQRFIIIMEEYLEISLEKSTIDELDVYLRLSLIRNKNGNYVEFNEKQIEILSGYKEYKCSEEIFSRIQEFDIGDKIIPYFAAIFLGSRKANDYRLDYDDKEIGCFTRELIRKMEDKMGIDIPDHDSFAKELLIHVRPMYFRLVYGIRTENILSEKIKADYKILYDYLIESINEIDSSLAINAFEQEVAYLCMYFGGWFKKYSLKYSDLINKTILIICHSGRGTSLFIKEQLIKLIGHNYAFKIDSYQNMQKYLDEEYLLKITTLNYGFEDSSFIRVTPILTGYQKLDILKALSERIDVNDDGVKIKDLIDLIKSNTQIEDEGQLAVEIIDRLSREKKSDEELIKTFANVVYDEVDYEEAIAITCSPLIEAGIVTDEYRTSVLNIIENFGLYFEISPGLLMIHSSSDILGNEVAISVSCFKEKVNIKNFDREISTIIAFTTPDSTSHRETMKKLLAFVSKDNMCKKLVNCDYDIKTLSIVIDSYINR